MSKLKLNGIVLGLGSEEHDIFFDRFIDFIESEGLAFAGGYETIKNEDDSEEG